MKKPRIVMPQHLFYFYFWLLPQHLLSCSQDSAMQLYLSIGEMLYANKRDHQLAAPTTLARPLTFV